MWARLICDELNIEVESCCVIKRTNIHMIMSCDELDWTVTWDGIVHINGCHNLIIWMPINGDSITHYFLHIIGM